MVTKAEISLPSLLPEPLYQALDSYPKLEDVMMTGTFVTASTDQPFYGEPLEQFEHLPAGESLASAGISSRTEPRHLTSARSPCIADTDSERPAGRPHASCPRPTDRHDPDFPGRYTPRRCEEMPCSLIPVQCEDTAPHSE